MKQEETLSFPNLQTQWDVLHDNYHQARLLRAAIRGRHEQELLDVEKLVSLAREALHEFITANAGATVLVKAKIEDTLFVGWETE